MSYTPGPSKPEIQILSETRIYAAYSRCILAMTASFTPFGGLSRKIHLSQKLLAYLRTDGQTAPNGLLEVLIRHEAVV